MKKCMLFFTLLLITLLIAVLSERKKGGLPYDELVYADTTGITQLAEEQLVPVKP